MKTMTDDDRLLQQFFAEHQQHMADNGFTERVLVALPDRGVATAMILRRWKLALDSVAALCAIILVMYLGIYLWDGLKTGTQWIISGSVMLLRNMSVLLQPDNILVQLLHFLRHLTEMLPSATQLLAIFLATLILLPITVKAALRH